jgi:hypothetical protein
MYYQCASYEKCRLHDNRSRGEGDDEMMDQPVEVLCRISSVAREMIMDHARA